MVELTVYLALSDTKNHSIALAFRNGYRAEGLAVLLVTLFSTPSHTLVSLKTLVLCIVVFQFANLLCWFLCSSLDSFLSLEVLN